MINTTEYRIGNYVHVHGGNDYTFCREGQPRFLAKLTTISNSFFSWENIDTVPRYKHYSIECIRLNRDWLELLNFDKGVGDYYGTGIVWKHRRTGISLYEHDERSFSLYRYNDCRVYVKFVHSLQNLYFQFVNEELTINKEYEKEPS